MLVHCRTGSLEIWLISYGTPTIVHCRTGSLEKVEADNRVS